MASSSGFQPTPSSRIGVMPACTRTLPGIGRVDAAEDLEQRALAAAVAAHDAERLAAAAASKLTSSSTCSVLEAPRLEHAEDVLAHRVAAHARDPERLRDAPRRRSAARRSQVLRRAWARSADRCGPPPSRTADHESPGRRAPRAVGSRAVDQHRARELDDRRRRPQDRDSKWKRSGMMPQRIDDRRDEEPGLRHHVPDLVQIAVAQEEDARGQREPDDDQRQRRRR